jgi:hypothetical protein
MSLLYHFRDSELITDDEDELPEERQEGSYFRDPNFGAATVMSDAFRKSLRYRSFSKDDETETSEEEEDLYFNKPPVSASVQVTPSIVLAENMNMSSGQTLLMLTPNIPDVALPSLLKKELRTADGLLNGVAENLSSLAGDAARKIFAQFFISALRTGLVTRNDTIVMAREADKQLRQMEYNLQVILDNITLQGSTTSTAKETERLLERELQALNKLHHKIRNTNPLVADLNRGVVNVSMTNSLNDARNRERVVIELKQKRQSQNSQEDSERLLKAIVRMKEQTKELLIHFVNGIRREDVSTHDVALNELLQSFDLAIHDRIKEVLTTAAT